VVDQWNNVLKTNNIVKEKGPKKDAVDLTVYDEDISKADSILRKAAVDKSTSPDEVIEQLLNLEKLMRQKNKLDEGATSRDTIRNLNGAWRLVFTTGTINTQKKIGKINYFPIKAVQTFNTDTTPYTISNGIYVGTFPLLRFTGEFEWKEKLRKLVFDFDAVFVLGLRIGIKKGDAVKIGSSTGLGSEDKLSSVDEQIGDGSSSSGSGSTPMFLWISANEDIATARGGGGGLALWKRDLEMQQQQSLLS